MELDFQEFGVFHLQEEAGNSRFLAVRDEHESVTVVATGRVLHVRSGVEAIAMESLVLHLATKSGIRGRIQVRRH
jgi:hypothetical protein